jgi:hypothetical protein
MYSAAKNPYELHRKIRKECENINFSGESK